MKTNMLASAVLIVSALLASATAFADQSCVAAIDSSTELPQWLTEIKLPSTTESAAFTRAGVALRGVFKPKLQENEEPFTVFAPSGKAAVFDGVQYVEFPNSTAMTTRNSRGETREFILTRGVKPYLARINEANGSIDPKGYVSDVLLFERVGQRYVYRSRILASNEAQKFFFEDPRISVININGQDRYFLSGTDYSPHVRGSKDPDVMNRYVELKVDADGLPLPVHIRKDTGKPTFRNLSPAPKKTDAGIVFVDAKNGTIAQNELGQIVVRTRMRPDFKNSYVQSLADGQSWKYAEQVFVFSDWNHFQSYNWNDSLIDLFHKRGIEPTESAQGPITAMTIIRDTDLKERLESNQEDVTIATEKGKGLGPGTRPLRVRRDGNRIMISESPTSPEAFAGTIPQDRLNDFTVRDGQVIFVTFDHEIRYLKQKTNGRTFYRRHYSASTKFFDETLTRLIGYDADTIQPVTTLERGQDSGILDLQHVYPMGWTLQLSSTGPTKVRVYAGAADAHTTIYDFDIVRLIDIDP
ncbi:MAG TPA: hypothetical protein VM432_02325 [Bdellovibrionales bacterium]|nr:hypothetical protein [Bdellovibrionales bacterium]